MVKFLMYFTRLFTFLHLLPHAAGRCNNAQKNLIYAIELIQVVIIRIMGAVSIVITMVTVVTILLLT